MTASGLKDDLTGRAMGGCPKRLVGPRKRACGGACLALIFAAKFCLATHGKGDQRILFSAPLRLMLSSLVAAGATFSIVRNQRPSITTTLSSEQ